jgi:CPA1 family monovalent cation:H+ antiporter
MIVRRAGKSGRQRLNRAGEAGADSVRSVEAVVVLIAVATVVAAFAKRLRVPAPSLLVVAGLAVGLLPGAPAVHVPPAVVSLVVLPPLLYAASEELSWRDLRAVWRPVAVLAVGLVLASAAAVAAVAGAAASLSASMAFVLGAVLASTDPVAVSALARRLSLPARVQTLVQAESLFNDGTSLVLFQIAVSLAVGGTAGMGAAGTVLHGAGEFAVLAGGGAAAGAVVAAGVIVVRRRITDPVLETVTALITPYLAYLLGQALHVSGVTAVIVAGLVIGARRSQITTAQTRLQLHSVYQTVIFGLESVVFALIGLELPTLVRELGRTGGWPLAALAVTGALIATRVAWVFPVLAFSQWRHSKRRPSWPVPAVVTWAGTRGVVPLAAVLSIPLTTASGAALPQRDLVLVLAAAAIVISLIVQGFTLEPLARLAGFGPASAASPGHEETVARLRLAEAGLARLEELADDGAAPDEVIDRLRTSLQSRIGTTRARLAHDRGGNPGALTERELRGDLIAAENAELSRLYDAGTISAATRQRLQRSLDLETTRLAEGRQ